MTDAAPTPGDPTGRSDVSTLQNRSRRAAGVASRGGETSVRLARGHDRPVRHRGRAEGCSERSGRPMYGSRAPGSGAAPRGPRRTWRERGSERKLTRRIGRRCPGSGADAVSCAVSCGTANQSRLFVKIRVYLDENLRLLRLSTMCGNRRTVEGRRRHEKYSGRRFARLPPASAPLRAPQTKSAGNDRLARRHGRRTQGARPDTSPFAEFTPPPLAIVLPDLARRRPLVFLPPPSNWRDRAFDPTMFRPVRGVPTQH